MARHPTIKDLAKEAGVGTATIDRALNARGGVSARLLERIAGAAARIGYDLPQVNPAFRRDTRPKVDLAFVLHKASQGFYQQFADQITRACAAHPLAEITPHLDFAAAQTPEAFHAAIETAAKHGAAIAATAINHPSLSQLVGRLSDAGCPVFSLLNDFAGASGAGYFGLDNMRVGRLAGWMMATRLQTPCRVGIFVGGTRWHGQGLRETGFRSALRDYAPQITLGDTVVNLETRQVTYEATLDLLGRHSDLCGLYVAGGGMEGAIAALRDRRPPGKVALIVNELTADTRAALADGYAILAIATPLDELCRALVDRMLRSAHPEFGPVQNTAAFEPRLYLPDSV